SSSACIIMEYLAGGSLASRIKDKGRIDIMESIRIISGILDGLRSAHGVMVIHRDVKPQNIIFDAKDQPKITNFGVALLPSAFGGLPDEIQSPTGSIVGTPLYMSPEQISKVAIDHRADLYSTGAVLYEMLSGRKLFNLKSGTPFKEIRDTIVSSVPEPLNDEVPDDLAEFTMKLLEKEPAKRFPNADRALRRLQKISESFEDVQSPGKNSNSSSGASSPSAMLEDVIRLFLIDGNIMSPAERRELDRRAERLGFTKTQARSIEEKVRAEMNIASLKDIEKYQRTLEGMLCESRDFSLKSEQIMVLDEMKRKMGIRDEEAGEMIKILIDRIEYRRRIESGKIKI
ncbi:MAG TPA: serine/threonine-protein kinase, partial [Victivallales bacterium]|nr:serine/threonine-protein kinase [Victivallales bacterium]